MTLKFNLNMKDILISGRNLVYLDGSPLPVTVDLNYDEPIDVTLQDTTDPAYPKCLCADMPVGVPASNRFELVTYPRQLGIQDEFYYEVILKLAGDYHFDDIADAFHEIGNPFSEYGVREDFLYSALWVNGWNGINTFDVAGRRGGSTPHTLWQRTRQGWPVPLGQWFKLGVYVKRHLTAGTMKVWINGVLVFDVSGVQTKDVNPDFYTILAKLYGGPIPKLIYCKGFEIHDAMPGVTPPPPPVSYLLDVWVALGGTTIPTGIQSVDSGAVVSIKAEADTPGYKFNGWQVQIGMLQAVITYPDTVNPLVLTITQSSVVMPLFIVAPDVPPPSSTYKSTYIAYASGVSQRDIAVLRVFGHWCLPEKVIGFYDWCGPHLARLIRAESVKKAVRSAVEWLVRQYRPEQA